ncbi:IcmT/TraK family protein, partial [Pseudomonas aeruginosa]|uniref:IcmT/TraK family protein n=1 Tax=Pseudomonas aeruginosa TaxID=287 RepID=UPI0031B69C4A
WWTMGTALAVFVFFGALEWMGISVVVALRMLRSWIAGPVRYGVAWWHKPKEKSNKGSVMASKNNTPAAAGADDVVLAVFDDGFRQMKGPG